VDVGALIPKSAVPFCSLCCSSDKVQMVDIVFKRDSLPSSSLCCINPVPLWECRDCSYIFTAPLDCDDVKSEERRIAVMNSFEYETILEIDESSYSDLMSSRETRGMEMDSKLATERIEIEEIIDAAVLAESDKFDRKFDAKMGKVDITALLMKKVTEFNLE